MFALRHVSVSQSMTHSMPARRVPRAMRDQLTDRPPTTYQRLNTPNDSHWSLPLVRCAANGCGRDPRPSANLHEFFSHPTWSCLMCSKAHFMIYPSVQDESCEFGPTFFQQMCEDARLQMCAHQNAKIKNAKGFNTLFATFTL